MNCLRTLALLLVLGFGMSSASALGVEGGLDSLDNACVLVRGADADTARQAALDQARALLTDPKITTIEKQVKAYAAATKIIENAYGTLDAFAAQGGFLMVQLDAGITLPVLTLQGKCQGVLLEYFGNVGAIVSLSKKLAKLGTSFSKGTDPATQPDRAKRLKALAAGAKKYAAFYKRYHKPG